jgi:hypothetical protein
MIITPTPFIVWILIGLWDAACIVSAVFEGNWG